MMQNRYYWEKKCPGRLVGRNFVKAIAGITLLSLLCCVRLAHGTTYSSDGSRADVQSKIDGATTGDIVTIPSGSFTWTSAVTLSKAVHLQGAGSGRIIGYSSSSVTFGTGSKTFTVQSGFTVANGTTLRIWRTSTNAYANYMLGTVTSLSGTTLTMNIATNTGSGTTGPWCIATEYSTRIVHSAGANVLLPITEATAGSAEVSGIQFTTGTGTAGIITWTYTSGGQPILIHDCWFWQTIEGVDVIRDGSTNRGIVWNCSFAWSFFSQSNSLALHFPIDARTEVWASASTMGAADTDGKSNIYVEDCDFHGGIGVSDFDSNSKIVWRYNVMDNAGVASHGYDTSAYGVRHWELYNNVFHFSNMGDCDGTKSLNIINYALLRGGTGVITDNSFEDITSCAWGDKHELQFGVWALGRWGASAYDADDGCVPHYPTPRQFGFGYVTGNGIDGQGHSTSGGAYVGDSEPAYIWNNTGFTPVIDITTDGAACVTNQYGHVPDDPNDYIQAGRDYKLGAKPGYVKYTYPHPLRGGTPPESPQHLEILP
jgi:hypothetical protein